MIVANGAGMFKVGEKDHDQNNFSYQIGLLSYHNL